MSIDIYSAPVGHVIEIACGPHSLYALTDQGRLFVLTGPGWDEIETPSAQVSAALKLDLAKRRLT